MTSPTPAAAPCTVPRGAASFQTPPALHSHGATDPVVSCVEQLQPCPCWGHERRGCSCPGAHPATVLWPGAGSSAGSTQCLCVCTGTVVTEMVPPRLLFPEDEVTGLQCLSSLEAESVPALPRLPAQLPLHSSPSWSVPQGRGLQALKQNGVRPPAPHGLTARGPLASALPPSARHHQLCPKQLRAPSVPPGVMALASSPQSQHRLVKSSTRLG